MTRSTNTTSGDETILEATSDELQLAQRVVDLTLEILHLQAEHLLFARIDLARDERGGLRLVELELIEPRLYFDLLPHLAELLARELPYKLRQTKVHLAHIS